MMEPMALTKVSIVGPLKGWDYGLMKAGSGIDRYDIVSTILICFTKIPLQLISPIIL